MKTNAVANETVDPNRTRPKLDLGGNNITDQGVVHLCDALKDVNCKLTKLNLDGNNMRYQGVAHLCDALEDANCKLTKLDVQPNKITLRTLHLQRVTLG